MREDFLHYCWKHKLFNTKELESTSGETIQILHSGQHNSDSGPDFLNAKIKIGKTVWAGNVEIHVNASEWDQHKHHLDKAYSNVILHIVFNADKEVKTTSGEIVATMELNGKIPLKIYQRYTSMIENKSWIPCDKLIHDVDEFIVKQWMNRMMIERLESKVEVIYQSLKQNKNNWEETFYQILARYFGFKVNAMAFEMLAKSLPLHILAKHKSNLPQLEALLFGQAGLLEKEFSDQQPQKLKKEYDFLRKKYRIKPIETKLWKYLRLHPQNFPEVRISQLADLIHQSSHLFSKIIEAKKIFDLQKMFLCKTSAYWDNHFRFDKESTNRTKQLGSQGVNILLINVVIPFLFAFGKYTDDKTSKDKALTFLEKLPAEKNSVTKNWEKSGIKIHNAFDSQALLQLKNEHCDHKTCLNCGIGYAILRKEKLHV